MGSRLFPVRYFTITKGTKDPFLPDDCNRNIVSHVPREAAAYKYFGEIMGDDPIFFVPKVYDEVSGARILTTEMVDGVSLEQVNAFTGAKRLDLIK